MKIKSALLAIWPTGTYPHYPPSRDSLHQSRSTGDTKLHLDWLDLKQETWSCFVHEQFKWTFVNQSLEGSGIEWLCMDVDGCKIFNIYKPSNLQSTPTAVPVFQHPCLYFNGFNYWHTDWAYNSICPDGECLTNW